MGIGEKSLSIATAAVPKGGSMWKLLPVFCFAGVLVLASPMGEGLENPAMPVHIIKPPVRCPQGTKPDANGKCRVVWERSADAACPEGPRSDDGRSCRDVGESTNCSGDDCLEAKRVEKREVEGSEREDRTQTIESLGKLRRTEAWKSEKKSKRRSDAGDEKAAKQARSKHAFIMMLKKKKMMQMMKPKPPPPPPPHHHPPHHSHQESEEEEEPEEQPAEEPEQPGTRLFFGDEDCIERENSTGGCSPDAETLAIEEAKKEFKEWKPEKSSESSDSSSSSDSAGESESGGDSGESEDEVLEKAIKIKLMKLFRMKQRYGPALRRWLADRLREYEDSFDD